MTRRPGDEEAASAGGGGGAVRRSNLKAKLRLGYVVFVVLLVIEVMEYALGTGLKKGSWPLLLPLAVAGAWPIVSYYMHITELRRPPKE